jgi:hypothetical protein
MESAKNKEGQRCQTILLEEIIRLVALATLITLGTPVSSAINY